MADEVFDDLSIPERPTKRMSASFDDWPDLLILTSELPTSLTALRNRLEVAFHAGYEAGLEDKQEE